MEVNKGAIALLMVLIVGAGGYLWYTMPYAGAKEQLVAAQAAKQTADTGLQAAQSELAAAQKRVEDAKADAGKLDDSVSRLQLATKAVPGKELVDDAAIVLMELADQSGITTSFSSGGDDAAATATAPSGNLQGATPVDLTFEAAGTYSEMMLFMSLVEGTVEAKDGKLHARDRLFNIVRLQIGSEDEQGSSSFSDDGGDGGGLVVKPGELVFTVTVRMYTSSTENAQGVGASTPDAAAAPLDQSATGGAGGAPAGTDPAAPVDPNAPAGGADGTVTPDPNAAGAAPGGAAPTGGAP